MIPDTISGYYQLYHVTIILQLHYPDKTISGRISH
jgi:hypothetical protein